MILNIYIIEITLSHKFFFISKLCVSEALFNKRKWLQYINKVDFKVNF